MNATVKWAIAPCVFLGLLVAAATAETFYLSGNVALDAEAPVSISLTNSAGSVFSVARSGAGTEGDPWLFDFSALAPAVTNFNMLTHMLYCARDGAEAQGYFVFNLAGAGILGTGATSFRTWRGIDHAYADHMAITNVGDIAMGGIDTRVTRPSGYQGIDRVAGNIALGTEGAPAGRVRVSFLHAHHDSADGNHDTRGGHVTVHSANDVLIADGDGNVGDIQTQSGRLAYSGDVTVKHVGDFRVNTINSLCPAHLGGTTLHSGHIRLDGGNASGAAVVEGNLITREASRATRTTEIEIKNYNSVTVEGNIDGRCNAQDYRIATLVKIEENIAGDIAINGTVNCSEKDQSGLVPDAPVHANL